MRFASLGSGSKGNCTVVSAGAIHVLIDCGFSLRETRKRLARLGLAPDQLSAVLVTHEHSDHSKGVAALAKTFDLPVYMTAGTRRMLRGLSEQTSFQLVEPEAPFTIGELLVVPVPVPHDACEPVQYVFEHGGRKLGLLTDLGSVTDRVVASYQSCHGLLLECNYDPVMLAAGPYPYFLKARVGGRLGHLSNEQAVDLLQRLETQELRHLVLGHLSLKNNTPELARQALARVSKPLGEVRYACQSEGFGWLDIA